MSGAAADSMLREPADPEAIRDLAGDEASGICYLDPRATQQGRSRIVARYNQDRCRRVAGEWKIQPRKLQLDWLFPLQDGWAEAKGG